MVLFVLGEDHFGVMVCSLPMFPVVPRPVSVFIIPTMLVTRVWWISVFQMADAFSIISWNVRGLNSPARREVVCSTVYSAKPAMLCLQETKMTVIDGTSAAKILSPQLADFQYLPASNTRGGILVGWNEDSVLASSFIVKDHSLSMTVIVRETNSTFS
jgi:hypothetical protein